MILLNFTVRNHRSLRDEVSIDLCRPNLRTLKPKDGDWLGATYRMAGVFGANGTGKSAIVDALHFALTAIRRSSTTWQDSPSMRRAPFRLDTESITASSAYELDFVLGGVRHCYGFEIDAHGVKREWLRAVPKSRWRTLLERDRDKKLLRPSTEVTDRELVLSRALQLTQSPFHNVAMALATNFDVVLVHHQHREARLRKIADMLSEGAISFEDLQALLEVADIGVTEVKVEEKNLPAAMRSFLGKLLHWVEEEKQSEQDQADRVEETSKNLEDVLKEAVIRRLLFNHRGVGGESVPFSIHDESDGTVAWLAVAVPALQALRVGSVLIVDELDASLHPHLLELLLGAFTDDNVNIHGAQIIFTTHEPYILSPLNEVPFDPEQIWLTDKTYQGVTELTNLADFPRHRDANVAKRYLLGRYGGIPRLSPSLFEVLISEGAEV